jgi:hypothetical protein
MKNYSSVKCGVVQGFNSSLVKERDYSTLAYYQELLATSPRASPWRSFWIMISNQHMHIHPSREAALNFAE